jgi:hypothetical protein
VIVVRPREERPQLHPLDVGVESGEPGRELGGQLRILLVLQQLVGRLEVAERGLQPVVAVDAVLETGEPLGQLLAAGGVVPDRGVGRLAFELRELRASAVDVKGTPWPTRSCRATRRDGRSARSWRRS